MISETMGFKSLAYIIMPKLTDLHCNAENVSNNPISASEGRD